MINQRNYFEIRTKNLTSVTINLSYYYENVFILMNIRMIGKNSMKHHYQNKKIFIVT